MVVVVGVVAVPVRRTRTRWSQKTKGRGGINIINEDIFVEMD